MKGRQIQRLLILLIALLLIESGILRAQDLSVAMNGNGEWVSRFEPLEFTLSRPISVGEHITLIIGTTDVTNLCTIHNDTLSYNPQAVPLPSGSVNVSVYLVTTDG